MYIDESGNTATMQEKGSKILVLTGCIIHEDNKKDIEHKFREIKQKYYFNPDVEIKSNYLRYANPDIKISSPIKLNDRAKYDELEKDLAEFMKNIDVSLISVAIDKRSYWSKYPAQNPYDAAYRFLLERFQTFLQFKRANGICIIDPREGTVEKKYIDKELDTTHHSLRWDATGFWKQCPNIIERVLFSTSDLTVGIQLCDLYCYPVFHIFEYDKKKGEYWRFDDVTFPKLYYHSKVVASLDKSKVGPVIDGTGLKFFPTETKKDFRYYQ
ncbi:MAG: hypothetical protein A3J46_02375 [Candidatus Yanofskybacteria bacterium RIFCSPHIGHO2_02_FULL_41_11]|uniref:DUF3800 domain-containing protein n=1 Tax=Candidatus Yanofskybacteria bacterium RIFCSPHIGHO2_02_FULL_41_11 TaxID=1802675 RepID=A0A1F8F8U1_9BACT|nr:MAG: hypothetical protein A3J46_02375 [Candidatus Yanofskybacteria bacterium RIFCSPHIGHO2_02_FULL_41_11]